MMGGISVLKDNYVPQKILHRDKQILEITQSFESFKKYQTARNLVFLGVTGSGKTTIIKKVCNDEKEVNTIYINCAETTTAFKTLKVLCGSKSQTLSDVIADCVKFLSKNPSIIFLDEIDKVIDLVNLMNCVNVIFRKTMTPFNLITLKRDIIKSFPSDVVKTLFFEKVFFQSYNATELKSILVSRLKELKIDIPKLDEGAMNIIAAASSRQGSARLLIKITLNCIQKEDFTKENIEKVYERVVQEDWLGFINDISDHEKTFLKFLIENCNWKEEISSSDIQEKYYKSYTPARISQLINVFENYSVIESRHQQLGYGGGRKRYVKFSSEEVYQKLEKEIV